MIWSDFEIFQSFIVENSKQCTNFNTACATTCVTFQNVGSNCGISKQALENNPNEFHGFHGFHGIHSIYGSKNVAMRTC